MKKTAKKIALFSTVFVLFLAIAVGSTVFASSASASSDEVTYNLKTTEEIGRALLGDAYQVVEDKVVGPFSTFTSVSFVKGEAPADKELIPLDDLDKGTIVAVITREEEVKEGDVVVKEAVNDVTVYSTGTILAPENCCCLFGSGYIVSTGKTAGDAVPTSLKTVCLDNFDTRNVTNLSAFFLQCTTLKTLTGVENFDTGKVTTLSRMFDRCQALEEVDLSGFDTSNVTDMSTMFQYCFKLKEIDVGNWDTSNVTNITYMFNQCEVVEVLDVSKWNTSNITNMTYVFNRCYKLKELDLSHWDTSSATTMDRMFQFCQSLVELDLSNFDTSNVTTMNAMFQYERDIQRIKLTGFDTSKVTDMEWMFGRCENLKELDLSSFNTSNVKNMTYMFGDDGKLETLDISNFDTSSLTGYSYLFRNTLSLKNIYLNMDFSQAKNAGPTLFNLYNQAEGAAIAPDGCILACLRETEVGVYDLTKLDTFMTVPGKITVGTTKRLVSLAKLDEAPTVGKIPYNGSNFYYDEVGRFFAVKNADGLGEGTATVYWCDSEGVIQKIDNQPIETEKREITVFWGTTNYWYDGAVHKPGVTFNKFPGDDVSLVLEMTDDENNPVTEPTKFGDYTVTITGLVGEDADKYVLPEKTSSTFRIVPYEILKCELSLDLTALEFEYNGESFTPDVAFDKYTSDDIDLILEYVDSKGNVVTAPTRAGTYTVRVIGITGDDAEKYALPENVSATFTIAKKVLPLDFTSLEFKADSEQQTKSFLVTTKDGNETVEVSYTVYDKRNNAVTDPTKPGTYTMKITGIIGEAAENYELGDLADSVIRFEIPEPAADPNAAPAMDTTTMIIVVVSILGVCLVLCSLLGKKRF